MIFGWTRRWCCMKGLTSTSTLLDAGGREKAFCDSTQPQMSAKKSTFVSLAFACLVLDAAGEELRAERSAIGGLMGRKRPVEVSQSGQESASCMWMLDGGWTSSYLLRVCFMSWNATTLHLPPTPVTSLTSRAAKYHRRTMLTLKRGAFVPFKEEKPAEYRALSRR